MLRLNVLALLEERGKSRYWLWKQMGSSYQNFKKMIDNQTKSISYQNIETLCVILNVTPNELFEYDFEIEESE